MSFFREQGDDSNLQYDDAAFLYFIASALSLSAIGLAVSIVNTLRELRPKDEARISNQEIFKQKMQNCQSERRKKLITKGFFVRILLLLIVCGLFYVVYQESARAENKLKGFDPYEILEVDKNATLREIKKSYRRLALIYHPDKNQGNAEAQHKFILISKSYECFTNEEKKINCFKYGNPDGAGSFRVGIGLPNVFIKAEYQYYVLPIVLFVLLVWVPWMMIRWNSKTKALDQNGISVGSYDTIFKAFSPKINKFTFLYILAAYPQLYEDENFGAISEKDKQELFTDLKGIPQAQKPVLYELTDTQLLILGEVFKFAANKNDYTVPGLREKAEQYLAKTFDIVKMFLVKEAEGGMLYNNPEWTIHYLGPAFFNCYLQFQRDYYCRSLLLPPSNESWLNYLSLEDGERNELTKAIRARGLPPNFLLQTLKSEQNIKAFCGNVSAGKRASIEEEMKSWPVYQLQLKLKLQGKVVNEITNLSYSYLYFRIRRFNETQGFSYIHNYPYPKKDKVYVVGIDNSDIAFVRQINLKNKKEYVNKVPYRTGVAGHHTLRVAVVHEACHGLDLGATVNFTVKQDSAEQAQKKVEFHPDDIHMERLYKNFFETLLDLSMDPEDNELSDSEGEEELKKQRIEEEENFHSESEKEEEAGGEQND